MDSVDRLITIMIYEITFQVVQAERCVAGTRKSHGPNQQGFQLAIVRLHMHHGQV